MIRIPGMLLLLLFCSSRVLAIDAVVAHTIFYQHDQGQNGKLTPIVETYWQINPSTLHYTTTPEKTIIARIKTDIVFTNDTGIVMEDHYVLKTVPRANIAELARHSILELRRYSMPPGFVHMRLVLTDLADSANRFSLTDTFTVFPPANTVFFSGLQMIDTFIESPAETVFKKNGRQQVPECANFIDDYKSTLHYYAELYNADAIPKTDYPLIRKVLITKNDETDPIGNFFKKDTVGNIPLSLVSGSFSIPSLPSGNYYLQATLENKYHVIVASQTLFFQRLNTHPTQLARDTIKRDAVSDTGMESVTVLNLKKTFIAKYTLGEVRAILKMLLPFSDPLGTQTIRGFLKKPDEIYMRYYVYNYFANIDKSDPGRAFKEFTAKIIKVNKLFNTSNKLGYETERGFIYLRYGEPTDIITVENESGSLPYEIWQYNTLTQTNRKEITNAIFLFYKPNQASFDYQLLHSTVEGELQNTGWRSYLYVNGGDGSSSNSRAEQYMEGK